MKDLSKMLAGDLGESKPSKLSPQEIQAKMEVIKELMSEMVEAMGGSVKSGLGDLGALKKVTVAAPDEESLEQGLEVAQELMPKVDEMEAPEKEAEVDVAKVETEDDEEDDDLYSLMQKKKKKMAMG